MSADKGLEEIPEGMFLSLISYLLSFSRFNQLFWFFSGAGHFFFFDVGQKKTKAPHHTKKASNVNISIYQYPG